MIASGGQSKGNVGAWRGGLTGRTTRCRNPSGDVLLVPNQPTKFKVMISNLVRAIYILFSTLQRLLKLSLGLEPLSILLVQHHSAQE